METCSICIELSRRTSTVFGTEASHRTRDAPISHVLLPLLRIPGECRRRPIASSSRHRPDLPARPRLDRTSRPFPALWPDVGADRPLRACAATSPSLQCSPRRLPRGTAPLPALSVARRRRSLISPGRPTYRFGSTGLPLWHLPTTTSREPLSRRSAFFGGGGKNERASERTVWDRASGASPTSYFRTCGHLRCRVSYF